MIRRWLGRLLLGPELRRARAELERWRDQEAASAECDPIPNGPNWRFLSGKADAFDVAAARIREIER